MSLTGRHILSVDSFSRAELEELREVTKALEPVARRARRCDVLDGAVLANLFFEASTRTRISFHSAFSRLGGKVVDTTGFTFSSISKGESLEDTARVIAGYADIIVMRHPEQGSVARFTRNINVPVINAGDGIGEHPSQALLDYYTIDSEFSRLDKTIDGMTLTMVGDLRHGRTIHSLCKLLSRFSDIRFRFIAPPMLRAPAALIALLQSRGHRVDEYQSLDDGLPGSDVIYATRIQRERIQGGEQMEGYNERFRVNAAAIGRLATPETVIMHPLPRDSREGAFDLASDLDDHPQLAIFRQTDNGVTVRMALFAMVLGVAQDIEAFFHRRRGYRPARYSERDADFYQLT